MFIEIYEGDDEQVAFQFQARMIFLSTVLLIWTIISHQVSRLIYETIFVNFSFSIWKRSTYLQKFIFHSN